MPEPDSRQYRNDSPDSMTSYQLSIINYHGRLVPSFPKEPERGESTLRRVDWSDEEVEACNEKVREFDDLIGGVGVARRR